MDAVNSMLSKIPGERSAMSLGPSKRARKATLTGEIASDSILSNLSVLFTPCGDNDQSVAEGFETFASPICLL
jgi:hypothetical protein